MSVGICPVLDSQPEFLRSTFNSGKDLMHFEEVLTKIAQQRGLCPLIEFQSMGRAEAVEYFGEDFIKDIEADGEFFNGRWHYQGHTFYSPETEWFPAAEGLKTVTALLEFIRAEPFCLGEEIENEEDAEGVLLALADIQELLLDAEQKQRRFHMTAA